MNGLDLKIPASDFRILANSKTFNLIVPSKGDLGEGIRFNHVVRLLAIEDEAFYSFMADPSTVASDISTHTLDSKCYNIHYLRECSLQSITAQEWDRAYGPRNKYQFVVTHNVTEKESPVKVICLSDSAYNLKALNSNYGRHYRNR